MPTSEPGSRSCNGCTLCCKLLSIPELDKPRLSWCDLCDPRKGCRRHADRPSSCRSFYCSYLLNLTLTEEWKPSLCKLIVTAEVDTGRILIHVDPARPDAWRREPYYASIKSWASTLTEQKRQLVVWVGDDVTVVLPDKDKHLGRLRPDQRIAIQRLDTPQGPTWDAVALG